jgi:CSLREA domain-containing protein
MPGHVTKWILMGKWPLLALLMVPAVGWQIVYGELSAGVPSPLQGGLFYIVNTTSDTVVIGACQNGSPGCSLRGAIEIANSHPGADGIGFDLPAGSRTIDLTARLPTITEGVAISGPGANLLEVHRSNQAPDFGIFDINSPGAVTIAGITISNGAGIFGGAIFRRGQGTVNLTNCTFSQNTATMGGGAIYNGTGVMNVTRCTLNANRTDGAGGALSNAGGATVNVISCTLVGNIANSGGGIASADPAMTVTNCTITANAAFGGSGGGIFANARGDIKSSLIALNQGLGTDVFDVDAGNGGSGVTSHGFNLIGSNSFAATAFPAGNPNANNDIVGTEQAPIDPKLDPNREADNGGPTLTIALLPNSPAIDKGTSNGLTGNLTTDQRGPGFARTFDYPSVANAMGGNGTDIGAFELLTPFSVSRKMHGAAFFDVDLPLTGTAGVECRTGGPANEHQVITTFSFPVVSVGDARVTTGVGNVSNISVSGSQVAVNLTGVTNAQTIVLTLFDVSDGDNIPSASIPMGILLGDTNGNGAVNASDVSQTKSTSGLPVNFFNFRTDVTASGSINASDVGVVKSQAGTALP